MDKYRIVRFRFRNGSEVIKSGLALEQAQDHCKNPETSSETCKGAVGRRYTEKWGAWFDGYEKEKG